MTDIVKRLRSLNEGNRWPMMDEAADEIERLREAIHMGAQMAVETQNQMQAEIERLRAALLQIANLNGVSTRLDAQKVANRALEQKS